MKYKIDKYLPKPKNKLIHIDFIVVELKCAPVTLY